MQEELTRTNEYTVPKGIVNLQTVNENLMEMMLTVKGNPQAIGQAQSMCEIADRIVNVAKTQIQQGAMIIEFNRMKGSL